MKILCGVVWIIAVFLSAAIGMVAGAVMGIFVGPAKLFELVGTDEQPTEETKDII